LTGWNLRENPVETCLARSGCELPYPKRSRGCGVRAPIPRSPSAPGEDPVSTAMHRGEPPFPNRRCPAATVRAHRLIRTPFPDRVARNRGSGRPAARSARLSGRESRKTARANRCLAAKPRNDSEGAPPNWTRPRRHEARPPEESGCGRPSHPAAPPPPLPVRRPRCESSGPPADQRRPKSLQAASAGARARAPAAPSRGERSAESTAALRERSSGARREPLPLAKGRRSGET